MKRCPTCNRTYTDDALSFCLEDGVPLLNVAGGNDPISMGGNFDPNVTLQFEDPRDTNPPPTQMIDPSQIPSLADMQQAASNFPAPAPPVSAPPPPTPTIAVAGAATTEPAWRPPSAPPDKPVSYSPPAQPVTTEKKSMLPWLLGGGLLLGILGLGIVGVVFMAMRSDDANDNKPAANANTVKTSPDKSPTKSGGDTMPDEPDDNGAAFTDDFSDNKWPVGAAGNNSLYKDGQYVMEHPVANQFIANYAPDGVDGYKTNGVKMVKVSVQGLDDKSPQFGYGLVLHGNITNGKNPNGYAFVIDSGKKPQVAVAELRNGSLTYKIQPKAAPMVLTGNAENELEVKLDGKKMDFYVNNELAASITDKGDLTGRVGFFTSTGGQVAFDNLEIEK
jgi:hypothetical protein